MDDWFWLLENRKQKQRSLETSNRSNSLLGGQNTLSQPGVEYEPTC
ncbi:MAG TPA: hypothetical protein V6D34_17585 [Candidatus Sericytochromatia bacterium]